MLNKLGRSQCVKQKGFSLIELLIVVAIILIIAAIAVPGFLRSRIAANDSAAASTIRTINTSEIAYLAAYPTQGFSNSLTSLGPNAINCTVAANVDATHACLLDAVVGCAAATGPCLKGGYNYYLTGTGAAAPFPDYATSAGPQILGTSGSKDYCSTPDAMVRQTTTGTAPAVLAAPGVTVALCQTLASYTVIPN